MRRVFRAIQVMNAKFLEIPRYGGPRECKRREQQRTRVREFHPSAALIAARERNAKTAAAALERAKQ